MLLHLLEDPLIFLWRGCGGTPCQYESLSVLKSQSFCGLTGSFLSLGRVFILVLVSETYTFCKQSSGVSQWQGTLAEIFSVHICTVLQLQKTTIQQYTEPTHGEYANRDLCNFCPKSYPVVQITSMNRYFHWRTVLLAELFAYCSLLFMLKYWNRCGVTKTKQKNLNNGMANS